MPSSASVGQVVFLRFSPTNDLLDISAIFLKPKFFFFFFFFCDKTIKGWSTISSVGCL